MVCVALWGVWKKSPLVDGRLHERDQRVGAARQVTAPGDAVRRREARHRNNCLSSQVAEAIAEPPAEPGLEEQSGRGVGDECLAHRGFVVDLVAEDQHDLEVVLLEQVSDPLADLLCLAVDCEDNPELPCHQFLLS